jgi:phage terminase large subunit
MTEARFKINNVYDPFLNADTPRTQIFFGGSASGKSVFLAQRAVFDIMQGKRNYLVIRNVHRTNRGSTFNEICKAINEADIRELFNINKTDMVITSNTGSQILFAGLDDVEKIKSITPVKGVLTDIWIEEATETDRDDVKQLNKRLRGKADVTKRVTLSFNPILQTHWIYEEYFKNWQDGIWNYSDDNLLILKTIYKHNSFLEADDIRELENETDTYFHDVYTLGNWGVLGSVIFKNWRVEDLSELKQTFDNHKNGLDFGYGGDPAAVVHTHYDKTRNRIYILDEMFAHELTNDLLAEQVKQMIDRQYVVCDSAEPKSIQELKNLGVRALAAKKGKDSVNFGIQWLQRQEIIIDVKCQNVKNEFMTYKWKEDAKGNTLDIPVDRDNHGIDALRYAYEDEMTERRLYTIDRNKLGI